MINAMIAKKGDNVIIAVEALHDGDTACYRCDDTEYTLTVSGEVPIYHKLACRDIEKGEPIEKYGQHIGFSACPIQEGTHVHVHNVESRREDLSTVYKED